MNFPFPSSNGKKKIVKVRDIPAECNIEKFLRFFKQYGIVLRHKWEEFNEVNQDFIKGAHKEVMIIEAEIEKDIPSFIYFEGEKLQITYQGQPQTCSMCQAHTHRAGDYPTRRIPNYEQNFPSIQEANTSIPQTSNQFPWIQPRSTKISRPTMEPSAQH